MISEIFVTFLLTNLNVMNFCGFYTSDNFWIGAAGNVDADELKLEEPLEVLPGAWFLGISY
jgi:hypothetical protein